MSEGGRKRSPAEVWAALERQAVREEAERVAELSREELDRELEEKGIDAKAARERGAALAAKLMAQRAGAAKPAAPAPATAPASAPDPAKVVSFAAEREKRRRPPWTIMLIAAAVALVVLGGGAGVMVALEGPGPTPTPSTPAPTQSAPPAPAPELLAKQDADKLRNRAVDECLLHQWDSCQSDLRSAGKLDPAGNEVRSILRLEGKAARGLSEQALDTKPAGIVPRRLSARARAQLTAALANNAPQALRLECAPGAEPQQICTQLQGALKNAGWTVTRPRLKAPVEVGGADVNNMLVHVKADTDDATQAAADALADALAGALLRTTGPDDAPSDAEAPLTLVVGTQ